MPGIYLNLIKKNTIVTFFIITFFFNVICLIICDWVLKGWYHATKCECDKTLQVFEKLPFPVP